METKQREQHPPCEGAKVEQLVPYRKNKESTPSTSKKRETFFQCLFSLAALATGFTAVAIVVVTSVAHRCRVASITLASLTAALAALSTTRTALSSLAAAVAAAV